MTPTEFDSALRAFMEQFIYPNEVHYREQVNGSQNRFATLELMDELQSEARARGLWNLFIHTGEKTFSPHGGMSP